MSLIVYAAAAWVLLGLGCILYGLALHCDAIDVEATGGPGR